MHRTEFYDKWFLERIKSKPTISKRIIFNEVILRIKIRMQSDLGRIYKLRDVGCGAGHFIQKIHAINRLTLSGVDITEAVIDQLRK